MRSAISSRYPLALKPVVGGRVDSTALRLSLQGALASTDQARSRPCRIPHVFRIARSILARYAASLLIPSNFARTPSGSSERPSTLWTSSEEALAECEARIAAARTPTLVAASGKMTVLSYAQKWQSGRDIAAKKDDQRRLDNHILPALGGVPLADLRPRHIRDFVEKLKTKKKIRQARKDGTLVGVDALIAPRTVLHVYGTLRSMLNDAVADEMIAATPCVLKDELPQKKDNDRTWRRTAVFTRDEVQQVISASPEDPRRPTRDVRDHVPRRDAIR